MIDTHCHLDFTVFDTDREELLESAACCGVSAIVVPGVLEKDWLGIEQLCKQRSPVELYAAFGLHPCFVPQHGIGVNKMASVTEVLTNQVMQCARTVAIGEIGLDYFSGLDDKLDQLYLFEQQLGVAKKLDLPVLLHVRKAHDDVLKLLRRYRLTRGGIVHAYSGSEQQASQYIELGFLLGIGGAATYDRAKKLHRVIRGAPIENLVLETDAPDMPPSFARGMRNSPLNIPKIAQAVADVRGVSEAMLARQTTENANRLFRLKSHQG